MTTVAEISGAVKRLPKRDLARFRKWFAEYDAAVWDRQIEADVEAGKLDALIREARRDHKAGRTKSSVAAFQADRRTVVGARWASLPRLGDAE
ncbi:MAG: hypothetical protein ABI665_24045 [Vicinamibacterales bacterium]